MLRRFDEWAVEPVSSPREENFSETSSIPSSSIEASTKTVEMSDLVQLMFKLTENVQKMGASSSADKPSLGQMVPEFDPDNQNQNVIEWINKVEQLKMVFQWSELTTVYQATSKLKGLAKTWYQSLPNINYSWSQWKENLVKAFPVRIDYCELLKEMLKRKKQRSETNLKYYYDKLALLNRCKIYGEEAVSCIIEGIQDNTVQISAKVGAYKNPEELLMYLKSIPEDCKPDSIFYDRERSKLHRKLPPKDKTNNSRPYERSKCYGCGARDHYLNACPTRRCDKCGRKHSGDCTIKEKTKQIFTIQEDKEKGNKYFLPACINGREVRAFIDLGASCCTIKEQVFKDLKINYGDNGRGTLKGYGGGCIQTLGCTELVKVCIDRAEAFVKFVVVPDKVQEIEVIIGHTFTEQEDIIIIKHGNALRIFKNDLDTLPSVVDLPPLKIPVWLDKAVVIPPGEGTNVFCFADYSGELLIDSSIRIKENNEYFIPGCLISLSNGKGVIPVINPTESEILLKNKHIFVRGIPYKEKSGNILQIIESNNKQIEFNLGSNLSKEERQDLLDFLNNYSKCFANNIKEIGCTNAAEMKIDLINEDPVIYKPYRMSLKEREKVKEKVEELLEAGIIRESNSPFASPVLLVKKKNGDARLCIDYRKLNNKLKQDRFPLPRIDDQLAMLHGYKYFSSLDLTSGYYQIPIEESSRYKTSFITPDGQYEFNRMPFGLSTAPSTFQRMMNKVLGPLRGTIATVYLDDILIPSMDFQQGVQRLKVVFDLLIENNLTLNAEKCNFLDTSINYLGFEINQEGMRPGAEKIKSVVQFPTPQNVHQVRQFLGLTGFFRSFIKEYAVIARSLTILTKKDQPWLWEVEQQAAFDTLKNKLSERPVLAIYNEKAETEVHTDASKVGIAGILLQKNENTKLQPVAYFSRQTSKAEEKYHSYELETLAIVESLKKFRVYLLDTQFKVVTDCNSVKATAAKKDLVPRIARWWLLLQEFTFTIEYRPGTRMAHVDALSRNPVHEVMRIEVADWVLASQLNDEKIHVINEILNRQPESEYERKVHKEYKLSEGRIYKVTEKGLKWLIPKDMRHELVRSAHDEFGHFGLEKTLNKLAENYWFPNMYNYVKRYINSCIPCLYHKQPRGRQEGLLHPIQKHSIPFHTIHLDHLGPFVRSSSGKKFVIVCVDAFTKYTAIEAVKDTKTKPVICFLERIINQYGVPNRVITDKGTCYTSKIFEKYCEKYGIQHIQTAVATPRANGQVERFNSTVLMTLATTTREDNKWDKQIGKIQFAINNSVHSITKRTPNELLLGYKPTGPADAQLVNLIGKANTILPNREEERENAAKRMRTDQEKQKLRYDSKRKKAKVYSKGELVLVRKPTTNDGQSRKLLPKYKGPFRIERVLSNDRYVISELPGSYRSRRAPYRNVEVVDHLKPWRPKGGVSETESESEDAKRGRSPSQEGRTVNITNKLCNDSTQAKGSYPCLLNKLYLRENGQASQFISSREVSRSVSLI